MKKRKLSRIEGQGMEEAEKVAIGVLSEWQLKRVEGQGMEIEGGIEKEGMEVGEEQGMNREIWRHLPREILMKAVQEHLPLPPLCRFRCVCKAWRSQPDVANSRLFRGLYMCRSYVKNDMNLLSLYDDSKGHFYILNSVQRLKVGCLLSCINGWAAFFTPYSWFQVTVCNIITGCRPRVLNLKSMKRRDFIFGGMSKVSGPPGSPALEEDYVLVAATTSMERHQTLHQDVQLRVYHRGQWSSSPVLQFPAGHALMYRSRATVGGNGVLRGSVYYFLAMSLDKAQVRLCFVDVLQVDKCRILCDVDPACINCWDFESKTTPKLAVCSGRIFLFYVILVGDEKDHTASFRVQVLDEGRLCWRYLSSFPEVVYIGSYPQLMTYGGDEFAVHDPTSPLKDSSVGYVYNVSTNSWRTVPMSSAINTSLAPICYV